MAKSLIYCNICDTYEEYNPREDTLACGHRPDNESCFDDGTYEGDFSTMHIEEDDEEYYE